MVACKELTNLHWRLPGRKRSPSFWNHPIWSSWKPSFLALRGLPSVYEGVSGKLVCRTRVTTLIRSLFCNAALLAAWSAAWFPHATSMLPFCVFYTVFSTSLAFSVQVGKPPIHPVNVSIMTSRYLYPWESGIWMKFIYQSSPMPLDGLGFILAASQWHLWNLSGQMDCLQESKDLITIFDWGHMGGQMASFSPNSSMCM